VGSVLDSLVEQAPPAFRATIWTEALAAAAAVDVPRSGREPAGGHPSERLRRLRDSLAGELVAFHDSLPVSAYAGDLPPGAPGSRRYRVEIPLTLFPRRDHGFARIECVVELAAESHPGTALRVIEVAPPPRSRVLARAELGGALELKTNARLHVPVSLPVGTTVATAVGELYGSLAAGPFSHAAVRECTQSEIVKGSGARWRFDDPIEPERVGAESHQLAVVIEVPSTVTRISGAGYLQAFSTTDWLTMNVGSFWRELKGSVRSFFQRGLPVEAYAEWSVVLPKV
jgi:hypothetical protein